MRSSGSAAQAPRLTMFRIPESRDRDTLARLGLWHIAGAVGGAAFLLWGAGGQIGIAPRIHIVVLAAAFVLGVGVTLWLREPRDEVDVARADGAVLVCDLALLVASGSVATQSPFALLVLPLVVAARFRRTAVVVTGAVMVAAATVRHLLLMAATGVTPDLPITVQLVVFGTAMAALLQQLSTQLDERRNQAEREAERARHHERRALTLHRITLAGVGGTVETSIRGALLEAHRLLPGSGWAFVGSDPGATTAAVGLRCDEEIGLRRRTRAVVGGGDTEVLVRVLERPSSDPAAFVVPVEGRGGRLGALLFEPAEATETDRDLAEAVADLLGVLVEAAMAYEREADLVERYRALDRLRTDFVSLTSHELRTPTTVIQGLAETLVSRPFEEASAVQPLAEAIARHAQRLGRVVDDLRTISTMDAGRLAIEARPFELTEAIAAALDGLTADGLVVEGPAGVRVVSDPERIAQIVAALVDNAATHGAHPIELRWRAEEAVLHVDVVDAGPGIPVDRRDEVFERFRTGRDVLSHSRGTGLGLPIARDLARLLGGDVALVPARQGTHVRLTLPTTPEAAGQRLDGAPAPRG